MQKVRGNISQGGLHLGPLLQWSLIGTGILRRAIGKLFVQKRLRAVQRENISRLRKFRFFGRHLEFFRQESSVVIPYAGPIVQRRPVVEFSEVALQFLLEEHLRISIGHVGFLIVLLIQLPGRLHRGAVRLFECIIVVKHIVVEAVACAHHAQRDIVVVGVFVRIVNIQTMRRNSAQLKLYLSRQLVVFFHGDSLAARTHIDQSSNDARFRIRDPYRLVRPHEQKCVEPHRVCRLEFLVHHHDFVGHERV